MPGYDPTRCHACEGIPYSAHAEWCPVGGIEMAKKIRADFEAAREKLQEFEGQVGLMPGSWSRATPERWDQLVSERIDRVLPPRPKEAA